MSKALREAAQQALAAMDYMLNNGEWYQAQERADALRAALAEDGRDWSLLEATQESLREHMVEIQRLRAALAQPATIAVSPEAHADFVRALHGEKGDLDAWLECYDETEVRAHVLSLDNPAIADWSKRIAATAQPAPARVPAPLTDEQIDMITAEQWGKGLGAPYAAYRAYARAIEAAHGITPAKEAPHE
jgi:hypothetical protein